MSFNKYPYTDFHEMNLDWMLARFKEIEAVTSNLDEKVQLAVRSAENAEQSANTAEHEADVIISMKNFITPEQFGAVGDGVTDDYDAFFDMLHNLGDVKNIYLGAKKYVISDTIFIPSDVTLFGCGESTEIYFNGLYGYYGPAINTAGDNICIRDLKINHAETSPTIIQASMLGGIGFSTLDFNDWTVKHQQTAMSHSDKKNLIAYNLYSDSNYILQTEGHESYTLSNVIYEKIYAPRSKVSIGGSARITNITMKDITASLVGNIGAAPCGYSLYSNIITNNLHLNGEFCIVEGCQIDVSKNYNLADGVYSDAFYLGNGTVFVNNVQIIGSNAKYTHYMTMGANTVYMSNVVCGNGYNPVMKKVQAFTGELYCSNCNLQNSVINIEKGAAVNTNANFGEYPGFKDYTKDAAVISREWIATEPAYGANVTSPVQLNPGTYIIDVSVPTSSKETGSILMRGVPDFMINSQSNAKASTIITLTEATWISCYINSSGVTFSDTSRGYLKAVKLK